MLNVYFMNNKKINKGKNYDNICELCDAIKRSLIGVLISDYVDKVEADCY